MGVPAAVTSAPPNSRARAASARPQDADSEAPPVDVDALVTAVVARLHRCGLLSPPPPAEAGAAAAAAAPALLEAAAAPLLELETEDWSGDLFGPPLGQQRLWLEDLRQQFQVSAHFGVREL